MDYLKKNIRSSVFNMNRRLYIKIAKYIYSLSWNKDMDKYLIHLNLKLDITVYSNELYASLYKYYLYIMIEL